LCLPVSIALGWKRSNRSQKVYAVIFSGIVVVSFAILNYWYDSTSGPSQLKPGVLIASGSGYAQLKGRNGFVYVIHGYRRISEFEMQEISLAHALVLFPEVETRGFGASFSSGVKAGELFEWSLGSWQSAGSDREEKRHLELGFDGTEGILTVGRERFITSKGNFFLVRLDESWEPSTQQLNIYVGQRLNYPEVLSQFKAALKENTAVQSLALF